MSTAISLLLAASPVIGTVFWRASWQSGLVVLAVWGICRLFPRLPASARCWLWRLTLLKFLLALVAPLPSLPLALLPAPRVAAPASTPSSPPAPAPEPALLVAAPLVTVAPKALSVPVSQPDPVPVPVPLPTPWPTPTPVSLPPLSTYLVCLWGLGLIVAAIRLGQLAIRARRWLRDRCTPVTDSALLVTFQMLARRLAIPCPPSLLTASDIALPLLVGFRKPAVVLPTSERLADFDVDSHRLMLAHELAHLRRHDLYWNWLATVVQLLFFFHPLVYLARREEELAREMDCDRLALEAAVAPAARYGAMLFQIATKGNSRMHGMELGISGAVGALKQRLAALKDRSPLSPGQHRLVLGLTAAVAIIALVPWRVVARQATPVASVGASKATTAQHWISGRVLAPDGKPVSGADVTLRLPSPVGSLRRPKVLTHGQTDADGSFRLEISGEAANVEVVVTAPGWGIAMITSPAKTDPALTISLGTMAGLSVNVIDPAGSAVPNLPLRVRWFPPHGSTILVDAANSVGFPIRTDGQGKVRIAGVPDGDAVYLAVEDDRFAEVGGLLPFPIARAEQRATITLTPATSASGSVKYIPIGKPAAGSQVMATLVAKPKSNSNIVFFHTMLSYAQGAFQFRRLQPGVYGFWVGTRDQRWASPGPQVITVSSKQPRTGIELAMTQSAKVTGHVTDIRSGQPVAGLEVAAGFAVSTSPGYPFYALTQQDGSYRIQVPLGKAVIRLRDWPQGKARLSIGKSVYRQFLATQPGIQYTADFRVHSYLTPTGAAPVTGQVLGLDGHFVANARVLLLPGIMVNTSEEQERIVRTDADGRFRAEALPASWLNTLCQARASSGNMVSHPVVFRLGRSAMTPLALTLAPGFAGAISGRVTDTAGQPLRGVSLRMYGWNGVQFTQEDGITDAKGRYRFATIWPDMNYSVETQPDGYVGQSIPTVGSMSFASGQVRANHDFVLKPARRTLSGQFVTASGQPATGITVSLSAGQGDGHAGMMDKTGHFVFQGVGDGPMTLNVEPRRAVSFRRIVRAADSPLRIVIK